ncbi:MAG: hypothetical protein IKZ58_05185 [Selenomonadaceae bacterium]|nr:hypothetical protein [Selenomonadaceae bacterium]
MLELLKSAMNIFDLFILAAAAFLFMRFDYSNLSTFDIIYIVSFIMWLIMLFIRIFIVYKKSFKQ